MKRYEQFPHTADIGVRVYGKDPEELFENAAFAMFDIIADLENLSGDTVEDFELEAPDRDALLVAWLDELLYIFYTKQLIFYKFQIEELTGTRLKARATGRPVGANRNRLKTEIKAATYSGLKIKASDGACEVEIIFDV
ncbi:MAG: archease [Candidatus Omnitrophica bacterium]|nr:archease [Candidatus Omnitrophota bacterium]